MPTPRAPSALRRAARTEDAAEDATEVEVIVKADMVSEDRPVRARAAAGRARVT